MNRHSHEMLQDASNCLRGTARLYIGYEKLYEFCLLFLVWCGNCNRNVTEFKYECPLGVQRDISCKLFCSQLFYEIHLDMFGRFSKISPWDCLKVWWYAHDLVWSKYGQWSILHVKPGLDQLHQAQWDNNVNNKTISTTRDYWGFMVITGVLCWLL